jgi:HD-GYP domain-containing protein (c-di-GMP phosphodiesterase class II)
MLHSNAVTIIAESSGTQFDPAVVEVFLDQESEFERLSHELADDVATSMVAGPAPPAANAALAPVGEASDT